MECPLVEPREPIDSDLSMSNDTLQFNAALGIGGVAEQTLRRLREDSGPGQGFRKRAEATYWPVKA